jgi:glycosyltransferase involved in cell wall biosynthesis
MTSLVMSACKGSVVMHPDTVVAQHTKLHPVMLLLTPYPIRRPRHGGQIRASAMVRAYEAAGFTVRSVSFCQPEAHSQLDIGTNDVHFPMDSPFRRYRGEFSPYLTDFCIGLFAASDNKVIQKIARTITSDVQVIQFEQPWLYGLARRLKLEMHQCRSALLVFSSHNIEAPMKREILQTIGNGVVSEETIADIDALEHEAALQSDLCLAVTAEDAEVLQNLGASKVILAPNGIDPWVADVERREFWRAKLPKQPWPIFIASAHPPNFTGFVAIVGDTLACIPPGSKLVIAGSVGTHLLNELSNTRWRDLNLSRLLLLGVLNDEDLAAVKSLAHAFLLPINGGGGSNIKTAEALYSGSPVVCTSTALRGFEGYRSLPDVNVANSPVEFQVAIRSALKQLKKADSMASSREMRMRLTWEVCLSNVPRELLRILAERRSSE